MSACSVLMCFSATCCLVKQHLFMTEARIYERLAAKEVLAKDVCVCVVKRRLTGKQKQMRGEANAR